ncbi:uncharacterized protein LOC129750627 [Uranotaenia lowii]|uniref:uncharacterized protein LOC129750627 n=1 Tax=Uranotaenia lowii TaxID=190385 RepID=UPI00247AE63E|nr:uncharacterized protein LOC129750627 [Uranotaenia lowii]
MSDNDPLEEDFEIEPMEEFEALELEKKVINEWGLQRSSLNRMIYCGITIRCLEVIQDEEINELFKSPRMLGQKVMFKHKIKEYQSNELLSTEINPRKRRRMSGDEIYPKNFKPDEHDESNELFTQMDVSANLKLEMDPLDDYSALQISEPQALVMPSLRPSMENGIPVKPTTAAIEAGKIPIRPSAEGLRKLLQSSRQGQWVLTYYNMYQSMNRKTQAVLTHCIVEQFLVYNIMFSHRLMRHYAQTIVQLFPTELTDVYYKPAQNLGWKRTCASGKLMDRWANQRMRHKERYPQQRPRIVDDIYDQRSFAEMSLVMRT